PSNSSALPVPITLAGCWPLYSRLEARKVRPWGGAPTRPEGGGLAVTVVLAFCYVIVSPGVGCRSSFNRAPKGHEALAGSHPCVNPVPADHSRNRSVDFRNGISVNIENRSQPVARSYQLPELD